MGTLQHCTSSPWEFRGISVIPIPVQVYHYGANAVAFGYWQSLNFQLENAIVLA